MINSTLLVMQLNDGTHRTNMWHNSPEKVTDTEIMATMLDCMTNIISDKYIVRATVFRNADLGKVIYEKTY